MNNEQFRRLLADDSSTSKSGGKPASSPRDAAGGGATPGAMLGSRMRSSIPMTPRSVTGVDFAWQLAEHRREGDQRPAKRFKSSAAPKGSKLPTGYQDRAQLRNAEGEDEDDLQKRVKALEEMVKLGQIDQATFEKLCAELGVGGDTKSTHMVKGLDWALLKRVRAGEDISKAAEKPAPPPAEEPPITEEDADEAFERLMEEKGQEELVSAPKEKKEKKKGTMAPPPPRPKTRDEILRELKASRAAAAKAPAPVPESTLGSKFKKVGDGKPEKKRFIESDENGRRREVLLITDADGNTKRKVRWLDKPNEPRGTPSLPMPDKDAKPLGMEVPADISAREAANAAPEEEDDDIFAGVGADYDPLAGIEQDDDSSSDEDGEHPEKPGKPGKDHAPATISEEGQQPTDATTAQSAKPRNYFAATTSTTAPEEPEDRSNPLTKDPTILAALKRAAALRQTSPSEEDPDISADASLRQKKFLEEARRRDAMDAADMDMGFGGSRIEDGEDDDEGPLLDFEGQQRGGNKRKRGPKKRKGDKDSADDVMRVLEGRKKKNVE
ncbi:uncharacterized protein N7496_008437 [Penicillium cataractarum]|uniref:RED-like N-terminal domain-containing protein n=1 Tax=Penicillium cataractarum TaxID=2100454 RepID=A0A9W9RYE2_9EURO|nr:uncharacterized protein N7496_008437 [Penicillium cataractarum]KAJ5368677.1 hypothetical protein N7496_008437 [Penicillium cataractarum]